MEYPKWLEKADNRTYEAITDLPFWPVDVERAIEMAKDAWAMAYLRGTGAGMGIEEFLTKYQDAPKNEIPYVSFDHPNDGGGI